MLDRIIVTVLIAIEIKKKGTEERNLPLPRDV